MSEIENSTKTDIDNNVQETPKSTPRKRISRTEKALLESGELLKSYGVTMEAGRQTRSSRRGTTSVETPKPEPTKRKQPNTPRTSKKIKPIDIDQIDSTNHVEDDHKDKSQISESKSIATSSTPEKIVVEENIASQSVSNNGKSENTMEVDQPIECIQSDKRTTSEEIKQPKIIPQPEVIEDSPIATIPIDDEPPIEEDSLPITIDDSKPSTTVEITEIIDDENVSVSADTTVTNDDNVPIVISPPMSENKDEPIELQSSPSDTDNDEPNVTNTQIVPDAVVNLESSSNEDFEKNETTNNSQKGNSLDLEIINSDSSLGETQDEPQTTNIENIQEQSQPTSTSTAEITITEIKDAIPIGKTNDVTDNSMRSNESPQKSVDSSNQKAMPGNFCNTITSVDTPVEGAKTNATTA